MPNEYHDLGNRRHNFILFLLAKFGHIRAADVAACIGPGDPVTLKIVERSFRQLEKAGLVMKRCNALGTMSYVLREAGVARILGICDYEAAKSGKDITPTGPTFLHRTISTLGMMVLNRENELNDWGIAKYFTEYEMQRSVAPLNMKGQFTVTPDQVHALKCAPDGLLVTINGSMIWLEAESTYRAVNRTNDKVIWLNTTFKNPESKPRAEKTRYQFPIPLDEVMWVIPCGDGWYPHENRIARAINQLPKNRHSKWSVLRLYVTPRLRLISYEICRNLWKG